MFDRLEDLVARLEELEVNKKTLARIDLCGAVAPGTRLPLGARAEEFGIYALDVRDRTSPTWEAEYLERDMSAKGKLYRILLPRLTEGTPEERACAAAALRVGLAALDGRDITSF